MENTLKSPGNPRSYREAPLKFRALPLGLCAALFASLAYAAPPAAMQFSARGTQIYLCRSSAGKYGWALEGPDASLYNAHGKIVARHYFGPHWQATDGSTIKGTVLDANASPQPHRGNISWLILSTTLQKGQGIFSHVNFVTRTDTKGGGMPSAACGAAQNGQKLAIPYTAIYTFFQSLSGP